MNRMTPLEMSIKVAVEKVIGKSMTPRSLEAVESNLKYMTSDDPITNGILMYTALTFDKGDIYKAIKATKSTNELDEIESKISNQILVTLAEQTFVLKLQAKGITSPYLINRFEGMESLPDFPLSYTFVQYRKVGRATRDHISYIKELCDQHGYQIPRHDNKGIYNSCNLPMLKIEAVAILKQLRESSALQDWMFDYIQYS